MNSHEESGLLSAFLDGNLGAGQQQRVQSHVGLCSACKEELQGLRALKSLLRQAPRKAMPAALATSLEARAEERLLERHWIHWILSPRVWVPAAAFSLGILAFSLWFQPNALRENEIPVETILAAHQRYLEEGLVPSSDLSSGNFSAKLASYEGTVE